MLLFMYYIFKSHALCWYIIDTPLNPQHIFNFDFSDFPDLKFDFPDKKFSYLIFYRSIFFIHIKCLEVMSDTF